MSVSGFVDFLSSHSPAATLLVGFTCIATAVFIYIIDSHMGD